MHDISKSDILAEVRMNAMRRWSVAVIAAISALLLIWSAGLRTEVWYLKGILAVLGALSGWLSYHLAQRAGGAILLTSEALVDDVGRVLARTADIRRIDRGLFAFKPTNGFLLRTDAPGPGAWRFGLWWRLGRRIGIGGMTPAAETKVMAIKIEALIAARGAG